MPAPCAHTLITDRRGPYCVVWLVVLLPRAGRMPRAGPSNMKFCIHNFMISVYTTFLLVRCLQRWALLFVFCCVPYVLLLLLLGMRMQMRTRVVIQSYKYKQVNEEQEETGTSTNDNTDSDHHVLIIMRRRTVRIGILVRRSRRTEDKHILTNNKKIRIIIGKTLVPIRRRMIAETALTRTIRKQAKK